MRAYFAILILSPLLVFTQLHPYKWRIGVNGGFSTYYGDLTPYRFDTDGFGRVVGHLYTYNAEYVPIPSWQISLERYLNPTISLKMAIGNATFSANDRFVKPDGSLWTDAPFFDRGLNVETSLYDASIGFLFKTDNTRFLSHRALFAPYIGIYAVFLNFDTYADLRDNEGNFYNLSNPNLRQNGTFETPLIGLKTEGIDYSTLAIGGRVEFGVQLRLSGRLNLNIATQITMTSTDYLDDVSLEYPSQFSSQLQQRASDPTGRRQVTSQRGDDFVFDSYLFHSVGLQWSFGNRGRMKKFPVAGGFAPPPRLEGSSSIFDPAIQADTPPTPTTEIDSLIEVLHAQQAEIDQLRYGLNQTISGLKVVEARLKISDLKTKSETLKSRLSASEDSIGYFRNMLNELATDTILPKSVRDSLSVSMLQRQRLWENRRDSLQSQIENIQTTTDSLTLWIAKNEGIHLELAPPAPVVKSLPAPIPVEQPVVQTPEIIRRESTNTAITDTKSNPDSTEKTQETAFTETEESSESSTQKTTQKTSLPQEQSEIPPRRQRERSTGSTTSRSAQRTESNVRQSYSEVEDQSPQDKSQSSAARTTVTVSAGEKKTEQDADRSAILKIMEQQTQLLKLLTEQMSILAANQNVQSKPTREISSDQPADTTATRDKSLSDRRVPDTASDESRQITFSTIAGFKSRTTVYFQSGKTTLDSSQEAHMREVARYLADSTSSLIILRGYADNTGTQRANFAIIQRRLEYIRQILVAEGVSAGRIRLEKGGIIVKSTPGSSPRDRRVEITLVHASE